MKNKRCQKNVFRWNKKNNAVSKHVLSTQMEASKSIFNQGLFCQRLWYSRAHKIILQFYIKRFRVFLLQFSTRDKKYLFEELIRLKDYVNINILLMYIREWEQDGNDDEESLYHQKLSSKNIEISSLFFAMD